MSGIGNLTKDETVALADSLKQQIADTKDLVETSNIAVKKAQGKVNATERTAQAAESAASASADALATATRNQALALQAASADPSNESLQTALDNANHDRAYASATYEADQSLATSARMAANSAQTALDSAQADNARLNDKLSGLTADYNEAVADIGKYGSTEEYPTQQPLEEDSGISGLMNSVSDKYADIKAKLTGEDEISADTQDAIDASGSDPDVAAEIYPKAPSEEDLLNQDLSSSDPDIVKEALDRLSKLKTDAKKEDDKDKGVDWNKTDPAKVTDPDTFKPVTGDPTKGLIDVKEGEGWESVHYADDLLDAGVKAKFLYKVKFVVSQKSGLTAAEIAEVQKAQFLIKTIDKPTIQMEHQDVNYYNFRTKVLTKITYNPLNMVFFDDAKNIVTNFFVKYLGYISPVFNRKSAELAERTGMSQKFQESSASSRIDYSFLDRIIVQQIYANGTASTIFTFINPRIEQFDFDGLDHEDSQPNLVTCSFIYDCIVVDTPSKSALIYNASDLIGAKTDLYSGGAVSARKGIKTASLATLMGTVNSMNGGVSADKYKAGTVYDVLKGNQFDLKSISGVSDVNIASTLGIEKLADGYLDSKMYNYSGKISSKLKGMNPIASKILSPLANQTLNAVSKPFRGIASMFDNTVSGAANGVGQAASDSATTTINSVINGASSTVNSSVKSLGNSVNGITQSIAGSFKSTTSDINNSISSGIGSVMDGAKSLFSSETKAVNDTVNGASSVASAGTDAVDKVADTVSGTQLNTESKPVEGVDKISS